MALHPLAAQFPAVADAYERGRPEYAPAVVDRIAAELRIEPGAPVLDLAAGTGKLTRALLGAGLDVVAVEPQQSLREIHLTGLAARAPRTDRRLRRVGELGRRAARGESSTSTQAASTMCLPCPTRQPTKPRRSA